ncbi:MAG: tetratricopeptide repeat protein [candidate division Zixibacteria bacterium]|nr:tetratricopeptide repeat protein [candidate division Zixibacteria bacterium]
MQFTDSVLKYIKPENEAAFWSMRANIFCRNNMLDSCAANYRHAIELDPDMNIIYNHLGRVYKEMGEKDKAIEYLREFIQREPDSELRPQIRVLLRELTR